MKKVASSKHGLGAGHPLADTGTGKDQDYATPPALGAKENNEKEKRTALILNTYKRTNTWNSNQQEKNNALLFLVGFIDRLRREAQFICLFGGKPAVSPLWTNPYLPAATTAPAYRGGGFRVSVLVFCVKHCCQVTKRKYKTVNENLQEPYKSCPKISFTDTRGSFQSTWETFKPLSSFTAFALRALKILFLVFSWFFPPALQWISLQNEAHRRYRNVGVRQTGRKKEYNDA